MPNRFLPGAGVPGLVSVVVPCYNRGDIVGETLDSLLLQTYGDLEIIVVDDGSTDNTRDVVAAYADPRVRYFFKANGGLSAARNWGLDRARGEFIAFLDSDDLWHEWKLESQIRLFAWHPEVGLIWSDMSSFATRDRILSERHLREYYSAYDLIEFERSHKPAGALSNLCSAVPTSLQSAPYYVADVFHHMFSGNLVHPSTAVVRRDRLRASGAFEPEITGAGGEDYHFYFRICSNGPVAFIDAPTTLYRIHASQLSTCNRLKEAQGNLSVITHWVERRPASVPRSVVRRSLANAHAWLGSEELSAGNTRAATRHLWCSLQFSRISLSTIRLLVVAILPPSVAGAIRSVKAALRTARIRPTLGILLLLLNDFDNLFGVADLVSTAVAAGF